MWNSAKSRLVTGIVLFTGIVAFSGGCANKEQAVNLYVDAVMLAEQGQNNQALDRLNEAVRINKKFSLAYSLLGDVYAKLAEYEKSAAAYEQATQLNPWSFKDHFGLGKVYEVMDNFADAVKAYARACELDPEHFEAHLSAAKTYYKLKDYGSAMVYGERAEQINANSPDVHELFGDIYETQQDYTRAIDSYKRALEVDSNDADVMASLGVIYLKTGRIGPANELLKNAVRIAPSPFIYKHLGYSYLKLAEFDNAIEGYKKAIELDSGNWDAHRGLGVAYILKGRDEDGYVEEEMRKLAVQHWNLSLDINPTQPNRNGLEKYINIYSR